MINIEHSLRMELIGVYVRLTNAYCIASEGVLEQLKKVKMKAFDVPLVQSTIGFSDQVGNLCVGNKNGLLVPEIITDQEYEDIVKQMPNGVKVVKVKEKLSALGNCIACNDSVALVHPDLEDETVAVLEEILQVEVYKTRLAGNPLVGNYCVLNNNAGYTYSKCN